MYGAAPCRSHTLQTSSTRSLPQMVTLIPGDAPYMKQFVHSKSQQYRRLKTEWRSNVYLRRSNVQVSCVCVVCCFLLLVLRFLGGFSKQHKLGLTQECSRISESTAGYTFTPCVGSFTSPGIDTR